MKSRLAPERAFPSSAYVPGRHPRPSVTDAGWVGDQNPDSVARFAIDLFDRGYYWEAHEQWEFLWRRHGRDSLAGRMAYGLIALAAAGVKVRMGSAEGLRRHAERASGIFMAVAEESPVVLGLPVAALIAFADGIAREGVCRPAAMGAPPEAVLGALPAAALVEKPGNPVVQQDKNPVPSHLSFRVDEFPYLTVNGRRLLARLYRPQGKGPFPGVLEVHGGAWTKGDRLNNAPTVEVLASRGVAVLSIDFRMPPEAAYPASLLDINFAVRWFKTKAREFDVLPDTIGGLGSSSGGHQIFLAAMRPFDRPYGGHPLAGDVDARLAYVIAAWPVIDPLARYRMAREKGMAEHVESHHAFWGNEAAMAEGNPQLLLERGEKAQLPPGLIVQGTNDDNVDFRMIERFAATYRKAGGEIDIRLYEGARHSFINRDVAAPAAADAIDRMANFILAHGKA